MLELVSQKRDKTIKTKALRASKNIPAICYGQEMEPIALQFDYQDFRRLFREVSTTQVFDLVVDGNKIPVLIHEISYNPVTNEFFHVDFLKVNMKEKVDATVPVELTGISPAVKNFGGVISQAKDEIEVRCLPGDIPHEISIDISTLENVGDSVHVSDLKLGDKVQILDDMDDVIVSVAATKEYEEASVEVPDEMKAEPEKEAAAEEEKK